MSKYIIDVGDAYAEHICGKGDMLCLPVRINEFEDNWLNTNIPLTPYTEPDTSEAYQQGYEEGYAVGEAKKNNVEDEAYRKGLEDVWECARKISSMDSLTRDEVFGLVITSNIFDENTASEAIEKIRQYEQKQEEIQVGDEVRNVKSGWTAVVTRISDDDCLTLMDGNGAIADGYEITRFTKTGRHFPELVELLRKMKEEQS